MTRSFKRALLRFAAIAALFALVFAAMPGTVRAAGTAPQTQITNTATASYQDSNNVSYTTNSNTVSTTVQNAPAIGVVGGTPQTVAPGQTVTDTFTVTNNGNAAGPITIGTPTETTGATATGNYVLNGALTGTCSVATPCTLATLNQQPALTNSAPGTPILIGVIYTVATTNPPATVTTTLPASITQLAIAANGPLPAVPAASANGSGTETDTIAPDARLDVAKLATPPSSAAAPIGYTITENNGGGFGARGLVSVGSLLGLTNTAGILAVVDKVPKFAGATTQTALTAAPTFAIPTGDNGTVYYSTSTDGLSAWSTTFNANATYVALFLTTTNPGGIILPSNPTGSTGSGTANVKTAQVTFSFSITQPQGPGSSNPGALPNIANSVIGGNPGGAGTPVIGPGITPGSTYEPTGTVLPPATFGPPLANTTPSPTTGTPPGGASNSAPSQAFTASNVDNAPAKSPGTTGSYNGAAPVSTQNDFTAVGFACTTNGTTVTASVNDGATNCTWPTAGVTVPGTVTNAGNGADTLNVFAQAPAGYTVQLFAATCPAGPYTTLPACTVGAAISAVSTSGGNVTTTAGTTVAAAGSFDYVAVYKQAAGTASPPFVPVNGSTIAYGTAGAPAAAGGVPTVGADANQTWQVIYPGGPIKLTKGQSVVSNCPGGSATPSNAATNAPVCPGGTILYTITYANAAPAAQATGGAAIGTEPAFALNGLNTAAGKLNVLEDGTVAGSWFASTFGIDAAPAPAISTTGSSFTYTGTSTLHPAGSATKGPSGFNAAIGGATFQLAPGASGTITFQVTVQ